MHTKSKYCYETILAQYFFSQKNQKKNKTKKIKDYNYYNEVGLLEYV